MQPINNKGNNSITGKIGEALAAQFLKTQGLKMIARNYLKPFGEIDIICSNNANVHFVEVKTVSYETRADLDYAVTHETWRPEEQVHQQKLHQISKAIQSWLVEYRYTGNFQIDVMALRIVPRETFCCVNWIQNIIIE